MAEDARSLAMSNGPQLQRIGGLQVAERMFEGSESLVVSDQRFRCARREGAADGVHAIQGGFLCDRCFVAGVV